MKYHVTVRRYRTEVCDVAFEVEARGRRLAEAEALRLAAVLPEGNWAAGLAGHFDTRYEVARSERAEDKGDDEQG